MSAIIVYIYQLLIDYNYYIYDDTIVFLNVFVIKSDKDYLALTV